MNITAITYARLRNLGTYENERVELTADVSEDEDPATVYAALRAQASALLFPNLSPSGPNDEEIPF